MSDRAIRYSIGSELSFVGVIPVGTTYRYKMVFASGLLSRERRRRLGLTRLCDLLLSEHLGL